MHLSEVHIANFRNLQKTTITLQRGLNVLVGANNSGKTNVLDAVRHALGPTASRSEPLWLREEDVYRNGEGSRTNEPIRVRLIFSGLSESDTAQFFEIVDFSSSPKLEDADAIVNFEAIWDDRKARFTVNRWGGASDGDRGAVPAAILEALPVVWLPALRDAEAALTPGNRSVLGQVLTELAKRPVPATAEHGEPLLEPSDHEEAFESIFRNANAQLERQPLVVALEQKLETGAKSMAGTDHSPARIRAATPSFRRILRTLQLSLEEAPVADLFAAGLGSSNVLFMATILSHLETETPGECPVLLVEEPEAHLSPQYTVLLAKHLAGLAIPQVLVTTHSPTFAACVRPTQVLQLAAGSTGPACVSVSATGMTEQEERQLQRMLDVTRASLYFAKGVILVEGVTEALLLPVLANLLGINLAEHHVSVLPICGVSFRTFAKLFGPQGLPIPVAIVTDSDPPVDGDDWKSQVPQIGEEARRVTNLRALFEDSAHVSVFASTVTLEYDLASASDENPLLMAKVWTDSGRGDLQKALQALASRNDQAQHVWRVLCRSPAGQQRKADFAHMLAEELRDQTTDAFSVPEYLSAAIRHAVRPPASPSNSK